MKAIQVNSTGAADVLEYTECAQPEAGPGMILIKTIISGASFGDVMMRKGLFPEMPPFPYTPGGEAAGEVVALGDGVDASWMGQRALIVLPGGCNAQYVVSPVIFAAKLPDTVSYETAVALGGNYLAAQFMLQKAVFPKAGQTVVVHAAAGGVGSALVQLCKRAGLTVIGVSSTKEKSAFVSDLGADYSVCSANGTVVQEIRELCGGKGADIIFNSTGGHILMEDLEMLAPFGQLVFYGMAGGPPSLYFFTNFLGAFNKSLSVRMFSMYSIVSQSPMEIGGVLQELVEMACNGEIEPKIHAKLPLNEVAKAHSLLESRQVMGKVVLEVQ